MPEESLQTETATVNDETTSDVETPKTDAPQTDPLEAAVAHRARILRRIGFAIFGGILVVAGVPNLTITGICEQCQEVQK